MQNTSKKVYFITGGGTGGHIYPALAVADKLAEDKNNEIYYVGNPKNLEYTLVKDKGYKFLPVNINGMPRKISIDFVFWTFKLLVAILQGIYYILKYKPDKVFGTGGYVSAPILMASIIAKKPFMMHDCDAQPGLVTRHLSKYAAAVSLAFENAKDFINNEKSYVTGNPLRPRFKTVSKELAKDCMNIDKTRQVVLVMGGSQGAKSINNGFVEIIRELSTVNNVQIIFQTGRKNYNDITDRLSKIYPDYIKDENLNIKPYFDDMITVLKASDIVISRAGSLSLSEIFASGVVPVLVPYPYAAADHQRKNARIAEEQKACVYIEDEDADANKFKEVITNLLNNDNLRDKLVKNSSKLANVDGLDNIIDIFTRAGS